MATRRVRRIRRTKKQVHRAHGRKTKHHHKRNHNRITRRHQGGMFMGRAVMKALFSTKLNPKNGPLYDGIEVYKVDDVYGVGSRPLNEYDSSDENDQRYAHKIRHYLDKAGIPYDPRTKIILNQKNFDKFVDAVTPKSYYGEPATTSYNPGTFEPKAEFVPTQIVIRAEGVQFGQTSKQWNGMQCVFDKDTTPFAQVVFVKLSGAVRVKFVLPSARVAYCALAQCVDDQIFKKVDTDYGLLSPSVTIELIPSYSERKEEWNVTSSIGNVYTQFKQYFDRCTTGVGYNEHAYKFYEQNNPIVSTLFFTKPTDVEYSPEVLLKVNNRNLDSCSAIIQAQPDNVLSPPEKETLNALIGNYKKQLSENDSNIDELKRLNDEITLFVKAEVPKLLIKATKAAAAMRPSSPSPDFLAGNMSTLSLGGVARQ